MTTSTRLIGYGIVAMAGAWVASYAIPLTPIMFVGLLSAAVPRSTPTVERPAIVASAPPAPAATSDVRSTAPASNDIEIPVQDNAGTFVVPVLINGVITLNFTVDKHAATVALTDRGTYVLGLAPSEITFPAEDTDGPSQQASAPGKVDRSQPTLTTGSDLGL